VDSKILGRVARDSEPLMRQVFIVGDPNASEDQLTRQVCFRIKVRSVRVFLPLTGKPPGKFEIPSLYRWIDMSVCLKRTVSVG